MSHLSMKCACGATFVAHCPTVADIPAARALAKGWGYDARGFVKCPGCLEALQRPAEDLTPEGIQLVIPGAERVQAPEVKQMELF